MDLDSFLKTEGEGRNVLEGRLRLLVEKMKQLDATNKQLLNQIGVVQEKCTELLEENRALKASVGVQG